MRFSMKLHQGFTLIDILLSLACLVLITGMVIPAYARLQTRNDIDDVASIFVQNIRKAQLQSQAMYGDTAWGVYATSGSILIFKGGSYGARDSSYDEVTSISNSISVSGVKEITFSKLYGLPSVTGTTTFTSPNNETRSVFTNQKGMLSY